MKRIRESKQISTFWFDLGNVIIPFDFSPAFKKVGEHAKIPTSKVRQFFVDNPHIEKGSDEGAINAYQLYRLIKNRFSIKNFSYDRFKSIWTDIFKEDKSVEQLIRRIKSNGHQLILISNINKLHYDHLRVRHDVLNLFDKKILSYKVKSRKPNKKIYKVALSHSKAKPNNILYIDDRVDLTTCAKEDHGVHVHTFKSYSKLKKTLKQHNMNHII